MTCILSASQTADFRTS